VWRPIVPPAIVLCGLFAACGSRGEEAASDAGPIVEDGGATEPTAAPPSLGGRGPASEPAGGDAGLPATLPAPDAGVAGDGPGDAAVPPSAPHASCGADPPSLVEGEGLADWSCQIFTYQDDLWMLVSWQGTGLFDYRFGGAGAVAEMRDVQDGYAAILAPSFKGEMTDRVIQWVWWDLKLLNPLPNWEQEWAWRFNVTQAGTSKNAFNPTVRVQVDHAKCLVDVYSVPDLQWLPEQDPHFQTRFSALTRYRLVANGDVLVQRVVLTSPLLFDGAARDYVETLFEAWTPFRVPRFNALARSFYADGRLGEWYATTNLQNYPMLPVETTSGYAAVVKTPDPEKNLAVGLVYGTKQACLWSGGACSGPAGTYYFNQFGWGRDADSGLVLLPGWKLDGIGAGMVIEQQLYLVPAKGAEKYFVSRLEGRVAKVPAPRLMTRAEAANTELCPIVDRLEQNLAVPGTRTEHVAGLVR
jgi:hypothetical protein